MIWWEHVSFGRIMTQRESWSGYSRLWLALQAQVGDSLRTEKGR
jgi:hypothetical protein